MSIVVERTPNPLAMKFTVGAPVGGPATYRDAESADQPFDRILAIDGVRSVFATADFITVSANEGIDWDAAVPDVVDVLEAAFG